MYKIKLMWKCNALRDLILDTAKQVCGVIKEDENRKQTIW